MTSYIFLIIFITWALFSSRFFPRKIGIDIIGLDWSLTCLARVGRCSCSRVNSLNFVISILYAWIWMMSRMYRKYPYSTQSRESSFQVYKMIYVVAENFRTITRKLICISLCVRFFRSSKSWSLLIATEKKQNLRSITHLFGVGSFYAIM